MNPYPLDLFDESHIKVTVSTAPYLSKYKRRAPKNEFNKSSSSMILLSFVLLLRPPMNTFLNIFC